MIDRRSCRRRKAPSFGAARRAGSTCAPPSRSSSASGSRGGRRGLARVCLARFDSLAARSACNGSPERLSKQEPRVFAATRPVALRARRKTARPFLFVAIQFQTSQPTKAEKAAIDLNGTLSALTISSSSSSSSPAGRPLNPVAGRQTLSAPSE